MNKLILFLLGASIASCAPANEPTSPTYGEVFFSNTSWNKEWSDLSRFSSDAAVMDPSWQFLGMDSISGIDREYPENLISGEPVLLPHRLDAPNHSLWYRAQIELPPGLLGIRADDGAQLWVNGKRLHRSDLGEFFEITTAGAKELLIRVVNNAMAGGLHSVYWMERQDFESWKERTEDRQDSLLLVRKRELLQSQSLSNANLDEYPILFSSPVMLLGTDGIHYVRWISEKAGECFLQFPDGSREAISSLDGVFTYEIDQDTLSFDLVQEKTFHGKYTFAKPSLSDHVKLAVWGDSQGGWETFEELSKLIGRQQVDYSIGLGDLVNDGSETWAYERFLEAAAQMKTVQIPVPGNHDYDGYYDDLAPTLLRSRVFREEELTYGVNYLGPVALMRLDPNGFFPVSLPEKSAQLNWFLEVIESEKWRNSAWKILAIHQPPYSQGWPGYHGEISIRKLLEPYFHRGLIDVVMAGHTHDYERLSQGFSGSQVQFFIFGGAGGGLEPVSEDSPFPQMDQLIKKHHVGLMDLDETSLSLKVLDQSGGTLDSLFLRK